MNFCKTGLAAFLFLISLISIDARAQKNFVEGYVVDDLGDTLRGLIDDKNWLNNPGKVSYRKNQEAPVIVYTAADVRAFSLNFREHYRSKVVLYDESPHRLQDLGLSPDPEWRKDTLFLRVEVEGVVSLYYLRENTDKEHFFVEKNGAGAEDLLNVRYFTHKDGVKLMTTTQQYKSQLKHYLGDCNALTGKLYDVGYKLAAIKDVVEQYNRCSGQAGVVQQAPERRRRIVEVGLVLGGHLTNLRFASEGGVFAKLTDRVYRGAFNGVGGISVDLFIPRRHRQFVIHNELVYKPYDAANVVERPGSLGRPYVKEDTYFRVGYVQGNFMFRYHRATFAKVRPFVQGGCILGKSIRASSLTKTETTYSSGTTYRSQAPALDPLGKFTTGIAGGVGVTMGSFGVEARYERASGLSTYDGLRASTQSIYFLTSYTLR